MSLQELKAEPEESRVRSKRRGPPQVAIKMSPVCLHSEPDPPSRCPARHNWLYTPHGTDATRFIRFLCGTEAAENDVGVSSGLPLTLNPPRQLKKKKLTGTYLSEKSADRLTRTKSE